MKFVTSQLSYFIQNRSARRDVARLVRYIFFIAAVADATGWPPDGVLVAGFGGFRAQHGAISFAPRLPRPITRLVFHLWYRRRRIRSA